MDSLIYNRALECRTIRRFARVPAPSGGELTAIIECARLAPGAANLQRLRFKLILGEDADRAREGIGLGGYLPESQRPTYDERPSAYIVLLSDSAAPDTNLAIDMGLAAELIVLRAAELGYGACIIRNFRPEIFSSFVSSEGLVPGLVIALGTPAEEAKITDVDESGSIKYYRDENGVNIVPKRTLSELIID